MKPRLGTELVNQVCSERAFAELGTIRGRDRDPILGTNVDMYLNRD
jgi:hypothetical protein